MTIVKTHSDTLTSKIIGSAIDVHKYLGPGLLESIYEECLAYELKVQNINFERQVNLPILYKGFKLEGEYRVDLLIENEVVVEIKSVSQLAIVHESQLLTYLKLLGGGRGLLINFNVPVLKDGIRRIRI